TALYPQPFLPRGEREPESFSLPLGEGLRVRGRAWCLKYVVPWIGEAMLGRLNTSRSIILAFSIQGAAIGRPSGDS
ncbi:hypothetical protein C7271_26835, partial [filamentous cyanobacterium CCP5]